MILSKDKIRAEVEGEVPPILAEITHKKLEGDLRRLIHHRGAKKVRSEVEVTLYSSDNKWVVSATFKSLKRTYDFCKKAQAEYGVVKGENGYSFFDDLEELVGFLHIVSVPYKMLPPDET